MSSWPNRRELAGTRTDRLPTRDEDLDLELEFSWSQAGERRDLRDTEGDLSLDQNSEPLILGAEAGARELERDLAEDSSGEVTEAELEEDITEDWRESEVIVLAASSNADLEDAEESLASVSTYMVASSWREKERARLEDTGCRPALARAVELKWRI